MKVRLTTAAWMRASNFALKGALLALFTFAPLYGKAQSTAAQPLAVHNIVLVHGAWADGSSWNKIIPLLEKKGFHVTAVHLPFSTLADDAATVKRALALQDGPVLLVGHSYGGAVITEAGMIRRVAGFVYVAEFAPDQGQSAGDLNNQYPATPGDKEFSLDANGFLKLTDQGVAEDFAQDLTTAEKQLIAATQGQVSGPNELGAKVTTAAWRQKPTLLYRRRPGPNDRAGVGDKARRAVTCEDDPHRVQPCSHAFTSNPGRRFHRGCCGRSIR